MAMAFYFSLLLIVDLLYPILALRGGKQTGIEHFRFMVQIYDPQFVCAGSLINDRFVLTAAHCFISQVKPRSLSVRAGARTIVNRFDKGYKVLAIQRHPKYSSLTLRNDIALLLLRSRIAATPLIGYTTICREMLRSDSRVNVITAGWNAEKPNEAMHTMDIKLIPSTKCVNSFPQLPSGAVCGTTANYLANDPNNNSSLCYGDSGDPLLYKDRLCGIAIAFNRCGRLKHPNIYTDLHYHRKFIMTTLRTLPKLAVKLK